VDRNYFASVFIGDSFWGPIGEEQAASEKTRLFHCGHCSTAAHKVYHNILGYHCHIKEADLLERIDTAINDQTKEPMA
jgi:hypothetical protein